MPTTASSSEVFVRWLIRKDLPQVLAIEESSFECAWNESEFIGFLRTRDNIGLVAEVDGEVAGFVMYSLNCLRIDIESLAVHAKYRRSGVGSAIVNNLKRKLAPTRRTRIRAKVRETNLDALLFFKEQGFRAINVLKNYYPDCDDDAYVMIFNNEQTD